MVKQCALLCAFSIATPGAELGLASWYGGAFVGRMAASGEIFRGDQLTAAHKLLPFGTRVLVRRTDVDRSVVVRINDRGPFVESRIIDLSQAAARVLGMVQPGVVPVSLEVVDAAEAPMPTAQTPFAVQVGAYRLRDNAFRARQAMEHAFGKATVVHRQRDDMWCVLVGDPATRAEADSLAETVRKQGGTAAFVVRASDSPAPSTE